VISVDEEFGSPKDFPVLLEGHDNRKEFLFSGGIILLG